jgi:hypothetical protein
MNTIFNKSLYALGFCLMLPTASQAEIITFDFTGRFIVADPGGTILVNNGSTYTPMEASLTYNTVTGLGNSDLSLTMSDPFWNDPVTFHDITMTRQAGTNLITGQVLVDWIVNFDMPLHVEWDATGLFNAIDYGLQAGDVLSGSDLYRDANGNGVQDAGEFLIDISSETPYSDSLGYYPNPFDPLFNAHIPGGPAPMAATSGSLGFDETTPFPGFVGYFDIGTGNSMHVTSVSAVPVPAAAWLFGSGLIGLIGIAKRRKA